MSKDGKTRMVHLDLCLNSHFWYLMDSLEFYGNLNIFLRVFQPHVHGDERSAEDEHQHCYKRHAGKI